MNKFEALGPLVNKMEFQRTDDTLYVVITVFMPNNFEARDIIDTMAPLNIVHDGLYDHYLVKFEDLNEEYTSTDSDDKFRIFQH